MVLAISTLVSLSSVPLSESILRQNWLMPSAPASPKPSTSLISCCVCPAAPLFSMPSANVTLNGDMTLLFSSRAWRKRRMAKSLLLFTSCRSSSVRLMSCRGFCRGSPMYCPMKKMLPVERSLMMYRKGLSAMNSAYWEGAASSVIPMTVAAAASVPFSSSFKWAFCRIMLIQHGSESSSLSPK